MEWSGVRIVLASTSPRRRELLSRAGVPFEVVDPELDDADLHMGNVPLGQWVASLAYLKAQAGAAVLRRKGPVASGTVVIGADTLVDQDGQVLSKAKDAADAERMIRLVQGRTHEVLTGVALLDAATGRRDVFTDCTLVTVGPIGDERIAAYIASGNWRGKSGAYNLDEQVNAGWPLTTKGDPGTVVGLPIRKLLPRLEAFAGGVGRTEMGGGGMSVVLIGSTILSPWVAIPLAAVGMVLLAGYTLGIQRDDVPLARRRLRTASGVLHMFIIGALAFGTSIASTDNKKLFGFTWLLVVGLVSLAVILAACDMIVTIRQTVRERRQHAIESAEKLARELLEARQGRQS